MKFKPHAGASLLVLSRTLAPIFAAGVSITAAAPASAQSVCTPDALGIIICAGAPAAPVVGAPTTPAAPIAPVLDVVGSLTPVTVILGSGFQSPQPVTITTLAPGADIDLSAIGSAVIDAVNQPGLILDSAAGINAQITNITTAGDGATGALLRAVDDVIFVGDGAISTVGANAPAIDALGRSVGITAGLLSTVGDNSDGALIRAAGTSTLEGGAIRTAGTDALAFNISNDAAACILLGAGGCTNTVNLSEVTTEGFGGIGGLVTAAAGTSIDIGVLRTGGDQAAGLNLATDPTACIALGVGNCGTAFTVQNLTTSGANSPGALVRAGGPITANVGVLQTAGDQAAGLDLASQPEVCAVLGAGNCGTSFSVGQLTTSGAGATGVLTRIAGPTTGNVGVLRTDGDDAAGIDIASDPTVCAIVGAGACDVNLVGQNISTGGNGAAAVLINAIGNVTTSLGAITTAGDGSTGLSITQNPLACLAIGPGSCRVAAVTGPVDTGGDNSPGVDVDGNGDPVVIGTGPVNTGGDNSPGVTVTNPGPTQVETRPVTTGGDNSPGVVVDGSGGNGPTTVTTGPVTTGGANSPGVIVAGGTGPTSVTTGPVTTSGDESTGIGVSGTGPITVDSGNVTTGGATSPGIAVTGGAGPILVSFDNVSTRGPDSPGVAVSGTGAIGIDGGTVTTAGDRSTGVAVTGGTGPVVVEVDAVVTSGANADGIRVTTVSGDQTIAAGPITVGGTASNGVVATSSGCSAIRITARDDIRSAQGTGILASSACSVQVTTLPGASVTGRLAAVDVTSGTGSSVLIGDFVGSDTGPAIDTDGAASTVTIAPSGSVTGYVDLTDSDDTLINDGTFTANASSNFGAGTDRLINTGRFAIRPTATTAGAVTLTGLESFANSGTVDLRNGVTGDTLTVPGSFTGTGNSTLGIDLAVTPAGATADRLVVGGAATGRTALAFRQLQATPGVLVDNLVVVDAGAGSTADAFTLDAGASPFGLVRYGLGYSAATNDYALYGVPNTPAYRIAQVPAGARELFYRTNDAIGGHMQNHRGSASGAGEDTPRAASALWGQMFGSTDRAKSSPIVNAFGQSQQVDLDNTQDFFGGQVGYDFGSVTGGDRFVFGVTGGYASSTRSYRSTPDRIGYQAVNGGAYASMNAGAFFLNGLAKYEHYWIDVMTPSAGIRQKLDGSGYGGRVEAGLRLGSDAVFLEPTASIEYVRTNIDTLDMSPAMLDFQRAEGLRGKAGARLGTARTSGVNTMSFYLSGHYVHEFKGENSTLFASNGQTVGLGDQRLGDYGRGTIGFNVNSGSRVSGFIEAFGDYSSNYKGGGGRGGLSVKF